MNKIRKIGKVADIPKIGTLADDPPAPLRAKEERITIRHRPVEWGSEDPLEKAALQGAPGTLPERIVWKWLIDQGYTFDAQRAEMGGRMVIGGSVVDFVVDDMAGKPVALRVQGDYWHGPKFPDRQARDDEQYIRLTMMGYLVVDLWESDIYNAVRNNGLTSYIEREVFA